MSEQTFMSALRQLGFRHAAAMTIIGVIVVWELACAVFAIPEFVLPSPFQVVKAAIDTGWGRWAINLWATLQVVLIGFLISFCVSIPMAVMIVNSPLLARSLVPILVIVQSTPIVAVAPILVVTLGAGVLPRVVITCMITFFPMVVSTVAGLRSTPQDMIDLSQSLRASRTRQFMQIRLPYAIPHVLSATKIAVTLAVIGAVVAEFVASNQGLGYMIQNATSLFRLPQAFASLVALLAISLGLYRIVVFVERRWFRWSLPAGE